MRLGWLLAVVFSVVLCTAFAWAKDGDELLLSGSDVLCRPGEAASLAVKVERLGLLRKGVEGAVVTAVLTAGGVKQTLGPAETDDDGWVKFPVRFEEPGLYAVAVEAVADDPEAVGSEQFLIACRTAERVSVVVDIDDTLTASDAQVLSSRPRVRDPETVAVVSALAARYDLVYVTGRLRWGAPRTRAWLRRMGFPAAPLFVRDLKRTRALRSGTFKRQLLGKLRQRFANIVVGVGDEDSDVEAYTENGMLAILIEEEEGESWNVKNWSQIRELLLGENVSFTDELSGETHLVGEEWIFQCRRAGGRWSLEGWGMAPVTGSWPEVRQALFDHLSQKGRRR